MNFAPTPASIPYEDEYIVATGKACKKLPTSEAALLRSEMAGILRSAKAPKSNITKEERQAISELKKEDSIIILPADKGKATVVMQSEEYEQKLTDMLSDEKTYNELHFDPTARYKRELVAILSRLRKEEKISHAQYHHLFPTAENVPRIYGTPKIHKPGNKQKKKKKKKRKKKKKKERKEKRKRRENWENKENKKKPRKLSSASCWNVCWSKKCLTRRCSGCRWCVPEVVRGKLVWKGYSVSLQNWFCLLPC